LVLHQQSADAFVAVTMNFGNVQPPSECTQHILSFLALRDCLRFTATSTTALQESLSTLWQRRRRLTQQYALAQIPNAAASEHLSNHDLPYTEAAATMGQFESSPHQQHQQQHHHHQQHYDTETTGITKHRHVTRVGLRQDLLRAHPSLSESNMIVFPTVYDRIVNLQSLMTRLPQHALQSTVREIRETLSQDHGHIEYHHLVALVTATAATTTDGTNPATPNETLSKPTLTLTSAEMLIQTLRQIVRPLKLHHHILHTILFTPHDGGCFSLTDYIGDVWCVAHLWFDNDRNCSFCEGTPSMLTVGESLSRAPPLRYRSWLLLHANLLRNMPWTARERARLGLAEIWAQRDDEGDVLLENHGPSGSSDKHGNTGLAAMADLYHRMASTWTMPVDCCRTDKFMNSSMVLVYDDFGPLGPSFRGRDLVRVRDVTAPAMLSGYYSCLRRNGNSRHDALEWLCVAHEQAVKSRPMSVRSPIVRIT
jgi:hypothetical protein